MAGFVCTIWKELVWVFSSKKNYAGRPVQLGDYQTLFYAFPTAAGMLSLRYVLERFCFAPFGQYLGVKNVQHAPAPPNPVLESAYTRKRNLSRSEILGLAKQLDLTERQIEKWMRQRTKQGHPSTLTKFCQSSWLCVYYTCVFSYGLIVLWDKPWLWDITQCWTGFPTSQPVSSDIWWYYVISLSFYWSLFFSQFAMDVRRKDFWQMLTHHAASITLLSFSWLAGTYRIGSLVLVIHDCADMLLEAAKMARYADYELTCTFVFSVFTLVWIVTRLGVFPIWIIKHTLFDGWKLVGEFPAYYTFNGLLLLLLMLHCYWTYLILKLAVKSLGGGQIERDVRSSSEDDDE